MAAADKGTSWAILAASEMGKGVWLKARLAAEKPQRLIIWDTNDEYGALAKPVRTLSELLRLIHPQAVGEAGRFALRYVPRSKKDKDLRAEFEAWCTLVYVAKGATIVVEELADVTMPGFATPAWSKLNTRGRVTSLATRRTDS